MAQTDSILPEDLSSSLKTNQGPELTQPNMDFNVTVANPFTVPKNQMSSMVGSF
jgi:hypothetical protein